jgi:XTP/dITP diphosphohydrolase
MTKTISAILVSYNAHKFYEYTQLLKGFPLELRPLDPSFKGLLSETGATFEANATEKVNAIKAPLNTVLLAEDSGLMIEALEGAPGIHSRRFSGLDSDAANNKKVLQMMARETNRKATFVAVIAFKDLDQKITLFRGEMHGLIHTESAGTDGFGYDPIFIPNGMPQTLSELGLEYKNQHSHRHHALFQLKRYLKDRL